MVPDEVESGDESDSSSSDDSDSDIPESEIDPDEPRYCICNKPYSNRWVAFIKMSLSIGFMKGVIPTLPIFFNRTPDI